MAHLLMLHGHPVGYLPPSMASEILYDSNNTVAEKIDGISNPTLIDSVSVPVSSGGVSYGNMNIYKFSNGMKMIDYRNANLPYARQNDIATIPSEFAPTITPIFVVGESKNDYSRIFNITGNKVTAYLQRDNDSGAYFTCYYV